MADTGHERTNDIIDEMTKQIEKEYEKAAKAVEKKLNAYLKSFDQKEAEQLKLLDAGKITEQQFNTWRQTQLLTGQRWQDLLEQLTGEMVNANDIARSTIRGHMADVYTLNRNYAAYQVEQDAHIDTSWTLYNRRATENLFKNNDNLLPMPKPGGRAWQQMQNEDTRWNQQKINSSMIQGILQGDGIRELSGRLMHVVGMNENSAVRSARTMTTYVQNKARDDTFAELAEKGVEMEQQWVATLDDRTRSTHRWLHGEVRSEEGTYSNGLRFPGDPLGDPEEVYNCRCTEISHVKGFPLDIPRTSPKMTMDFDEWLGEKPERLADVLPAAEVIAPMATTTQEYYDRFISIDGIDNKHRKKMAETISQCGSVEAQNLYYTYADQLRAVKTNLRSNAYFNRYYGGIFFGQRADERGDDIHAPMQITFHEFGHMIDWLSNGKKDTYLSATQIDGVFLRDLLMQDYDSWKKTLPISPDATGKDVVRYLRSEYRKADGSHYLEWGNVSDILEFCTGESGPLGIGHGASYHRTRGKTESEFFAEVLDSAIANPAAYARMQEVFPSSVEWVWKAVRGKI